MTIYHVIIYQITISEMAFGIDKFEILPWRNGMTDLEKRTTMDQRNLCLPEMTAVPMAIQLVKSVEWMPLAREIMT
jgi:hypothetical protein